MSRIIQIIADEIVEMLKEDDIITQEKHKEKMKKIISDYWY